MGCIAGETSIQLGKMRMKSKGRFLGNHPEDICKAWMNKRMDITVLKHGKALDKLNSPQQTHKKNRQKGRGLLVIGGY